MRLARAPQGQGYLHRPRPRARDSSSSWLLTVGAGAVWGTFLGATVGAVALWMSGFVVIGIGLLFWVIPGEVLHAWKTHEVGLWCLRIGFLGGAVVGAWHGWHVTRRVV